MEEEDLNNKIIKTVEIHMIDLMKMDLEWLEQLDFLVSLILLLKKKHLKQFMISHYNKQY